MGWEFMSDAKVQVKDYLMHGFMDLKCANSFLRALDPIHV